MSSLKVSRRELRELRKAIVDFVLEGRLSESETIDEFLSQRNRLQSECDTKRQLHKAILLALEEFQSLERDLHRTTAHLTQAQKAFDELAGALGTASFRAYESGEISESPAFVDRIAQAASVTSLREQYDQLCAMTESGIVGKVKAAVEKATLAARIKIAQSGSARIERQIGATLLAAEEGHLQQVHSDCTASALADVADARKQLSQAHDEHNEAATRLQSKSHSLCRALGLSPIERSGSLTAEASKCKKEVVKIERAIAEMDDGLPDTLLALDVTTVPANLAIRLNTLRKHIETGHLASAVGLTDAFLCGFTVVSDKWRSFLRRRKRTTLVLASVLASVIALTAVTGYIIPEKDDSAGETGHTSSPAPGLGDFLSASVTVSVRFGPEGGGGRCHAQKVLQSS